MKRKSLILILVSLSTLLFAQKKEQIDLTAPQVPMDSATKLISYSDVVELSGTPTVLYNKSLNWAKTYFKNSSRVIKSADSTNHKILLHPLFKVLNPPDKNGIQTMGGIVNYMLTIECRNGRVKYTFNKFAWKQPSFYPCEKWMDTEAGSYEKRFGFFLQQLDAEANKITEDYKKAMSAKPIKKDENW